MYNLTDLCCLCLVNGTIRSILLQDVDGIVVKNKLEYVFSEVIHFNTDVLKNICTDCLCALNYVHKFKKECLQNLISLNNYIENMPIKTEDNRIDHPAEMQEVTSKNNFANETQHDPAENEEMMQIKNSYSSQSMEVKCALSNTDNSQHLLHQIPQNIEEIENLNVKQEYINHEIDIKWDPLLPDGADSEEKPRDNFSNEAYNSDCDSTSSEGAKIDGNAVTAKSCKCDQCNKTFSTPSALKRHSRAHTEERPFKCLTCEKAFSRSDSLLAHKCNHSEERPYACDVCNKTFSFKSYLTVHKRSHTKERPSKCSECPKTFTHNSARNRHMRKHTEKKTECKVCEFKCKGEESLKRHMLTKKHIREHTSHKPFECELCNKRFGYLSNIKKHIRTQHNIKEDNICLDQSTEMQDQVKSEHDRAECNEIIQI